MEIIHLATLGLLSLSCLPTSAAQQSYTSPQVAVKHNVADTKDPYEWNHICPQLDPLFPKKIKRSLAMKKYINSEDFFQASARRLSEAVQINTTTNDDMQGLFGDNPVWNHMFVFSEYLKQTFPLINERLVLERINTHGLVYTWQGRDLSLRPTLLLAHQDVVPVRPESEHQWEHPPFSGDFDGTYVWGRGSIDCKSTLIAIMEAVEELLTIKFSPERTVILAFGFDEEISGYQGAKNIALHLLRRYREDGIAVLVDEGSGIMTDPSLSDSYYALVGVAEKGYLDAELVVRMESGHNLLPPKENSIEVMANLIRKIKENPFQNSLHHGNPALDFMFCVAQHGEVRNDTVRDAIKEVDNDLTKANGFLDKVVPSLPKFDPLFRTIQSNAVIQGGTKVNVIPERTLLRINHRIVYGTTVDDVRSHLQQIVEAFITGFNADLGPREAPLNFTGWDQDEVVNSISLKTLSGSEGPSPATSYSVNGTTPYSILHGTTRAIYRHNITMVAPMLVPGATDSRHYINVTKHIFRFSPGRDLADTTDSVLSSNAHGVNERVNMQGHVKGVEWYSTFIRNMDEADMD
ncbi:Carboxypeptidase S [Cytospora mali]|uniref:Carboxypeptidase S n=1 Tax=Cytospora mali TaxID=578113 RepID=A0A194VD08_CYTMA|nr:Carboxypeptidase S [Valsa mali var. pyri (nom. inval.)]